MPMTTIGDPNLRITHYKDLGYSTFFNARTGFFARVPEAGKREPFWSPHGPELMDISITNWCDKGCVFCYKSSTRHGSHMALGDYKRVIDEAAAMGTHQVALGGGNPNQHPDFEEILDYTWGKGVVPNYTTNGRGLTDAVLEATARNCGAVAVSAYAPYDETAATIRRLTERGIKTNVHFIVDRDSVHTAIEWLRDPPAFMQSVNALIFLNYKPSGRKVFEEKLLRYSDRQDEFFKLATSSEAKIKVGFDACCVSGVFARTSASTALVDACDAGRFSLYVSEDMTVYPCSFQSGLVAGDRLDDQTSLLDIWHRSENVRSFRNYFASDRCGGCTHKKTCMNGCPLFDELVVCGNR